MFVGILYYLLPKVEQFNRTCHHYKLLLNIHLQSEQDGLVVLA
jgi:hypothetical protein